MEQVKINKIGNDKNNFNSTALRVDREISRLIKREVDQLNKMKKGSKKVTSSDILRIAIPLITDTDRTQIMSQTVTSEDRQQVAYLNYSKKYKNISKNDFLDLIQYGEISINNYLPEQMKRTAIKTVSNI